MTTARNCTKCSLEKPLEAFSKAPRGKFGRKSTCKECDAARHTALTQQREPKTRSRPRREAIDPAAPKRCRRCGATKTHAEFSLSRRASETTNAVYRSECKACASERAMQWYRDNPGRTEANKRRFNLASLYGMTPEQYTDLLRTQGGVCAVCGEAPKGAHARERRLVVDHCHDSGAVRGLLCNRCNRAIGLLGDNPALMRRAISYLRRAGQKE